MTNTHVSGVTYQIRIHTRRDGLKTLFREDVLRIDVETTKRGFNSTWRVVLAPREYGTDGATAYDMVEAMDYCEIAIKRFGKTPRVVIRGFVTNILKSFSLEGGKPQRYIAISGEDYGKIIRMAYIHYAAGLDPFQVVAAAGSDAPLFLGYGIDATTEGVSPSNFMQRIFDSLILPNFKNIKTFIDERSADIPASTITTSNNGDAIRITSNSGSNSHGDAFGDFTTDIDADGVDGKRGLQCDLIINDRWAGAKEIPVENFIMEMAGAPWNEVYIDNAPNKSFLVFRPVPYRDRDGAFIGATHFASGSSSSYKPDPDRADTDNVIDIDQEDIIAYQIQRNDKEVFNYFFTDAVYSPLGEPYEWIIRSRALQAQKFDNPHYTTGRIDLDKGNANIPQADHRFLEASEKLNFSRIELFGFRKFVNTTKFLSTAPLTEDIKKLYSDGNTADPTMIYTGDKLNALLFNALEHNSVLETGVIEIKGNELIRPGMYVRFTDVRFKPFPSWYFVTDVNHTIVGFETYTTKLIVMRGEGHLDSLD